MMEEAARKYGVEWLLWGLVYCPEMNMTFTEAKHLSIPDLVQSLAARDVFVALRPKEAE
jgi:hypothetical protein